MYYLNDTIVAVSSPTSDKTVIVRLSGRDTIDKINKIFTPAVSAEHQGITRGSILIAENFRIDATLYLFASGHSYTGETLAELHFWSNSALTEDIIKKLLNNGLRMAQAGEFTARAYFNGRMDLAQAEAVNKIITAGNRLQLAAAEKLLAGKVADTTTGVSMELMQCLSLMEAGMDFSQEDINFISRNDAIEKLETAREKLQQLLSGSITLEAVTDLPSVGIAGATNAGKSSLLNKLLGRQRSIISSQQKTTRDVLTGICELQHSRFVLFDCAGLISQAHNQIDSLAQQAAVEALDTADIVLFCVDTTKDSIDEDIAIRKIIKPELITGVATKADFLNDDAVHKKIAYLRQVFEMDFIPLSNITGAGIDLLQNTIDKTLREQVLDSAPDRAAGVALTARHRQSAAEAIENINQAVEELKNSSDEIAAMMIRAAYQAMESLEREHIDEKILDNIFGQFCIGK
jgi:tRNA modification GTPase